MIITRVRALSAMGACLAALLLGACSSPMTSSGATTTPQFGLSQSAQAEKPTAVVAKSKKPVLLPSPCRKYTRADALALLEPLDRRVVAARFAAGRRRIVDKYMVKIAGESDQLTIARLQYAQATALLRWDRAWRAAKQRQHHVVTTNAAVHGGWQGCQFRYDRVTLSIAGSRHPETVKQLRTIAERQHAAKAAGVQPGDVAGTTSFVAGTAELLWLANHGQAVIARLDARRADARFLGRPQLGGVATMISS